MEGAELKKVVKLMRSIIGVVARGHDVWKNTSDSKKSRRNG